MSSSLVILACNSSNVAIMVLLLFFTTFNNPLARGEGLLLRNRMVIVIWEMISRRIRIESRRRCIRLYRGVVIHQTHQRSFQPAIFKRTTKGVVPMQFGEEPFPILLDIFVLIIAMKPFLFWKCPKVFGLT